mmetsp:Transcript_7449/g.25418  ORF Transcript_7449/g.25418 Transcript_7449/m.25418 type:complete len:234 (-) Transcript_7449:1563-2264(-)
MNKCERMEKSGWLKERRRRGVECLRHSKCWRSELRLAGMSGFRAVEAETRGDRAAKQDKTTLEKMRLAQRREKFVKYEDFGPVTEATPGALGYLADVDRFHTDTAGEEKAARERAVHMREEKYERKRNVNLEREDLRWNQMEQVRDDQQQKLMVMQNSTKGARNHSSVAYDCISLDYHPTPAGDQQKFEDDMAKYRAGVRTEKLFRYSSGDGYNPITGEELKPLRMPKRPDQV